MSFLSVIFVRKFSNFAFRFYYTYNYKYRKAMKLVCLSHIYQRTLAIFVKADVGGLKKIYIMADFFISSFISMIYCVLFVLFSTACDAIRKTTNYTLATSSAIAAALYTILYKGLNTGLTNRAQGPHRDG